MKKILPNEAYAGVLVRGKRAKTEAKEVLRHKAADMADPKVVRDYVNDMRDLLVSSSIN